MGGRVRAWRWNDYEERKGTAGGTTGKKRRRMRKAALLGERGGRVKMAERERVRGYSPILACDEECLAAVTSHV